MFVLETRNPNLITHKLHLLHENSGLDNSVESYECVVALKVTVRVVLNMVRHVELTPCPWKAAKS